MVAFVVLSSPGSSYLTLLGKNAAPLVFVPEVWRRHYAEPLLMARHASWVSPFMMIVLIL